MNAAHRDRGAAAGGAARDPAEAAAESGAARGSAEAAAESGAADDPNVPLAQFDESVGHPAPFDPLRLCVFTTVALIAAVTGPVAVLVFSLIAIRGYGRARRAGLMRSKCKLGDTRLVLGYLTVLAVAAAVAIPFWFAAWARVWG